MNVFRIARVIGAKRQTVRAKNEAEERAVLIRSDLEGLSNHLCLTTYNVVFVSVRIEITKDVSKVRRYCQCVLAKQLFCVCLIKERRIKFFIRSTFIK